LVGNQTRQNQNHFARRVCLCQRNQVRAS
jgi:hypothetical protein